MIRMSKKRWAIIAAAALATLAASAFVEVSAAAPNSTSVTLRLTSDFGNFDIQTQALYASSVINNATGDYLIWYDTRTKKYVPYLAKSWVATPSKITFTIRSGARCPNGDPITAQVVANSFVRLVRSKVGGVAFGIFGAGPFSVHWRGNKFTFSTATPDSGMLYGFAQTGSTIICPQGLAALQSNPAALATTTYGSGPYQVVSAVHGQQIVLQKRPDWNWGPEGITAKDLPDTITYKIVPDETTAANLLETGGLDIGLVTGPDVVRLFKDKQRLQLRVGVQAGALMLSMNQRPGHITDDVVIRHAIALAVSELDSIKGALAGQAEFTNTYFSQEQPCYWKGANALHPRGSVSAAQSYLLANGYTLSGGQLMKNGQPVPLTLLASNSQYGTTGEYLQSVLSQVGFKVNFVLQDYTVFAVSTFSGNWDVVTAGGTRSSLFTNAGLPYYSGQAPPLGLNLGGTGLTTPAYQQAIDAVNRAPLSTRCDAIKKLQQVIAANYIIEPLGVQTNDYFGNRQTVASFSVGTLLASADPRLIRMR